MSLYFNYLYRLMFFRWNLYLNSKFIELESICFQEIYFSKEIQLEISNKFNKIVLLWQCLHKTKTFTLPTAITSANHNLDVMSCKNGNKKKTWSTKICMRMKWKRPENIPTCIETLNGRRRDILSDTATINRTHRWPTIFGISSFLNLNDEWFIFSHYLIKCFSLSIKLNGNKEKEVGYVWSTEYSTTWCCM